MLDRAPIVWLLGRCRIVAREINRDGKRAARRAAPAYTRSVHVHRAAKPSSPALPTPRRTHVSTANQVACVQFDVAAARRQQCAARRSPPHFFTGRWQSPYSSLVWRSFFSQCMVSIWYGFSSLTDDRRPLFLCARSRVASLGVHGRGAMSKRVRTASRIAPSDVYMCRSLCYTKKTLKHRTSLRDNQSISARRSDTLNARLTHIGSAARPVWGSRSV